MRETEEKKVENNLDEDKDHCDEQGRDPSQKKKEPTKENGVDIELHPLMNPYLALFAISFRSHKKVDNVAQIMFIINKEAKNASAN